MCSPTTTQWRCTRCDTCILSRHIPLHLTHCDNSRETGARCPQVSRVVCLYEGLCWRCKEEKVERQEKQERRQRAEHIERRNREFDEALRKQIEEEREVTIVESEQSHQREGKWQVRSAFPRKIREKVGKTRLSADRYLTLGLCSEFDGIGSRV